MKINGIEIDIEKTACAVAAAYAVISSNPDYESHDGDIDNLLQSYLHAYIDVTSKDSEYLRALVE